MSRAGSVKRDGKTWYFVVDIANGAGRRRQVRKRGFATKGEARDALTANSEAMTRILALLKTSGIAEKDIQTSNFSVQPRYDYSNNSQPRLTGYDVSNTVTVAVRQLSSLGAVLDQEAHRVRPSGGPHQRCLAELLVASVNGCSLGKQ